MAVVMTAAFWGKVAVGAIYGAIIGAAVGGLVAAVTGGDIGKGILFGAVGGAVMGGISGAYAGFTTGAGGAAGGGGGAPSALASEVGRGGVTAAQYEALAAAGTQSTTTSAGGGFLDNLMTGLGDKWDKFSTSEFFSGGSGKGGMSFGQTAAMKGIEGAGTMYMKKKEQEAAREAQEQALQDQLTLLDAKTEADKALLREQAALGGGGGGGGGLSFDEQMALKDKDIQGALARTSAEIQGQKDLKQQEFDKADANRELAANSAESLGTGRTASSRSTESLTDIQERIRNGENSEGEPDVGYDVPVQYVYG